MSDFEINLTRGVGEHVRLGVGGGFVKEARGGEAASVRHVGHPVAACAAFEYRLAALRAGGFRIELPEPPSWGDAACMVLEDPDEPVGYQVLAEAMRAVGDPRAIAIEAAASASPGGTDRVALFGPIEEAAQALRGTFAYEGHAGLVRRAWLADADEVGLADGLMPPLRAADPRALGFDPKAQPLASHTLAVHALRRLLLDPAGVFVSEVRLEVTERLEPFVAALVELGRADAVTHLTLLAAPGAPLGLSLPRLTALACPAARLEQCLREPAPALTSLVVATSTLDAPRVLAELPHERLATVRYFGLRGEPINLAGCAACIESPLLPQLDSLDLGVASPMPASCYELIASRRAELAHLSRLVLPGEGLGPEIRSTFADWPNVVWASRTRAELADLDRQVLAGAGFGGLRFM
jgi:hypothetical protein